MDTAFYDRIHAYIPGWEFQKTSDARVHRPLRAGDGLSGRSLPRAAQAQLRGLSLSATSASVRIWAAATRRPCARPSPVSSSCCIRTARSPRKRFEEYLAYAMEMRRRVKEQLKKMGGLEYWDTSFSYIDRESGQETFVRCARDGWRQSSSPRAACRPGASTPSAPTPRDNRLALFLLQTQMNRGSGRIIPLGQPVEQDEGGDQDRRCLSQGEPQEPRHRPRPQGLRLHDPGDQPEPGQGRRRDRRRLLHLDGLRHPRTSRSSTAPSSSAR